MATRRLWTPWDYLSPLHTLVSAKLVGAPLALLPLLALWALPFLWIGVSMSMRRALDAGRSAWLALLFFVSKRGEFRPIPLPGERARLEGSTWYEMRLYPEAYWVLLGDA